MLTVGWFVTPPMAEATGRPVALPASLIGVFTPHWRGRKRERERTLSPAIVMLTWQSVNLQFGNGCEAPLWIWSVSNGHSFIAVRRRYCTWLFADIRQQVSHLLMHYWFTQADYAIMTIFACTPVILTNTQLNQFIYMPESKQHIRRYMWYERKLYYILILNAHTPAHMFSKFVARLQNT